jgi:aromatic ring-opening dioxygenase LigB subunit
MDKPTADRELVAMAHGLVFAAIAPHGDAAIPEAVTPEQASLAGRTQEAMVELGRRFAAARVEAVVIATPHNMHIQGHFGVGMGSRVAGDLEDAETRISLDCEIDHELAQHILAAMTGSGIPALGFSWGGNDLAEAELPIDWGTLVPLWFMGGRDPSVPVVVVTPARDLDGDQHFKAGAAIAAAGQASGKRVAFIASADQGHGHSADGPYGLDPASAEYDARVAALVESCQLEQLLDFEPSFVQAAKADSWWQMLMLHGAIGEAWRSDLLSYEVPTYFGMLCATFTPPGAWKVAQPVTHGARHTASERAASG